MKQDYTEIACVVDKSGSMAPFVNDTIGGFNSFTREQRALPGKARLTLILFDTEYQVVHNGKNIQEVPELTTATYQAGGNTALLDATARTIHEVGIRLAAMPEQERPARVLVVIITDGEENSSREFNRQQVFDMIANQRDRYNWQFIFLGAGQEGFAEGSSLGIQPQFMARYSHTPSGHTSAYRAVSRATTRLRSEGKVSEDWAGDVE